MSTQIQVQNLPRTIKGQTDQRARYRRLLVSYEDANYIYLESIDTPITSSNQKDEPYYDSRETQ